MKKKPYSALNGLIISNGETCSSIAAQIGISPQAMSAKMAGKSSFTADEIAALGYLLGLPAEEYYKFFVLPAAKKGGYIS